MALGMIRIATIHKITHYNRKGQPPLINRDTHNIQGFFLSFKLFFDQIASACTTTGDWVSLEDLTDAVFGLIISSGTFSGDLLTFSV